MNADIERLTALQRLDSAAQDAQRRLADKPERQKEFDARLDAVRERAADARHRLTENQNLRRTVEKEVAVHHGRLSKFRDQLMSVKTTIEYQAMQKEIEFAQKEVKALEDTILQRMLEGDDLTGALKRAEADLASEQKTVDADRRALASELSGLQTAPERSTKDRAELVKALNPGALAIFESVSRRRNGVAVAEARDGICTICHVRLRPQGFNNVLRSTEIVQCESCQRILYAQPKAPPTPPDVPQPAR